MNPEVFGGAREVSSEIETTTGVAAVTWTRHKFKGLKHFKLHLLEDWRAQKCWWCQRSSCKIETTTGVAAVTWTRHKLNSLKHFKLHLLEDWRGQRDRQLLELLLLTWTRHKVSKYHQRRKLIRRLPPSAVED